MQLEVLLGLFQLNTYWLGVLIDILPSLVVTELFMTFFYVLFFLGFLLSSDTSVSPDGCQLAELDLGIYQKGLFGSKRGAYLALLGSTPSPGLSLSQPFYQCNVHLPRVFLHWLIVFVACFFNHIG